MYMALILKYRYRELSFLVLTLAQSSDTLWDDDDGDNEKLKAMAKKFEEKYVSCLRLNRV